MSFYRNLISTQFTNFGIFLLYFIKLIKLRDVSCSTANHLAITHALYREEAHMKEFIIHLVSRYYPLEGTRKKRIRASSKKWIRDNWHSIIHTDEYRITKIEEVRQG